jgi:hypothetical protein
MRYMNIQSKWYSNRLCFTWQYKSLHTKLLNLICVKTRIAMRSNGLQHKLVRKLDATFMFP